MLPILGSTQDISGTTGHSSTGLHDIDSNRSLGVTPSINAATGHSVKLTHASSGATVPIAVAVSVGCTALVVAIIILWFIKRTRKYQFYSTKPVLLELKAISDVTVLSRIGGGQFGIVK